MKDSFQREIDYMRISITDRCNLRCFYCMPSDICHLPMEELLSYEEIQTVCREAVAMGIRHFKITGGEPLVRKDCPALIRMLKEIEGVEEVTLTTNGTLLSKYAKELLDAGVDCVNVSLDTMDRKQFQEMTSFDLLDDVLNGIDTAYDIGLRLKINTVLQESVGEEAWKGVLLFARERPIDVRFIEVMPIGYGKLEDGISILKVRKELERMYGPLTLDPTRHGNGPAEYYRIAHFQGSVGFIHGMHGKFCHQCNRIRMTATGDLKPCLCYERCVPIKAFVRRGDTEGIRRALEDVIVGKPLEHCFEKKEQVTEKKSMVEIGG